MKDDMNGLFKTASGAVSAGKEDGIREAFNTSITVVGMFEKNATDEEFNLLQKIQGKIKYQKGNRVEQLKAVEESMLEVAH